jgi:peptidoglycan/LPS O-acetylase OafA/YrhL
MKDGRNRANLAGPNHHLPALDGLRGLAVLFVLVFHIFQVEAEPASGLLRLAYKSTRIGQTGVDLFFVLSGFLITGILSDTKGARHYFRNFYARRTVRIFPLYYGVLAVATITGSPTPASGASGPTRRTCRPCSAPIPPRSATSGPWPSRSSST